MTPRPTRAQSALRAISLTGVAAAVMTLGTACGSSSFGNKAGPPYKACGQQIPNPAGSYLSTFSPGGMVPPNSIVELVTNCSVGAQVTVSPSGYSIMSSVRAKDGAYKAVKIEFQGKTPTAGTLVVSQHGRTLGKMTVLTHPASPSSGRPG